MEPPADNIRAIAGHCAVCGRPLPEQTSGRRRVTDTNACKQELYRRRRAARAGRLGAAGATI